MARIESDEWLEIESSDVREEGEKMVITCSMTPTLAAIAFLAALEYSIHKYAGLL